MKKFRIIIATLVFSLLFAGSAFAADKTALSNNAARHLIEKSNAAMDGVTAFKMEGVIEMLMDLTAAGESESVAAEVVFEGLVDLSKGIYVKYDMDMGIGEEEEAMSFEMLMGENGISVRVPELYDGWETMDDPETLELVTMALSGDNAAAEDMLKEMGLDIAGFEDKIYSNARYTRNMKILDKSYYVVDMSVDIKTFIGDMMGYMEGIYLAQEADMYEGYADEAMFMMNMLAEKIGGNMEISMYIEKGTYNLGYMSMVVDLDMDMEMLLGFKMDMFIDAFIKYSEFGSTTLPFPVIEIEQVEEVVEVEEVEEIEELEEVEVLEVEVEEIEEVEAE